MSSEICAAIALTILWTRSSISADYIHVAILNTVLGKRRQPTITALHEFLRCPLCCGFWISLLVSLLWPTGGIDTWPICYLASVAGTLLYDILQKKADRW